MSEEIGGSDRAGNHCVDEGLRHGRTLYAANQAVWRPRSRW